MKYYWIFQFYRKTGVEGELADVTEVEVLAYNYKDALLSAKGLIEAELDNRIYRLKTVLVPDKK